MVDHYDNQSRCSSYLPQRSQDLRLPSPFEQNELELWNVEFWNVECKKTSLKTLQIELHPVFSNVSIKHVQEKEKGKEI